MVYIRVGTDDNTIENSIVIVTGAIDRIRSGSNPAKELLEDERSEPKSYADEVLDDDQSSSVEPLVDYVNKPCRIGLKSGTSPFRLDSSSRLTIRITDEDFFGTSSSLDRRRHVSPFRYSQSVESKNQIISRVQKNLQNVGYPIGPAKPKHTLLIQGMR